MTQSPNIEYKSKLLNKKLEKAGMEGGKEAKEGWKEKGKMEEKQG